MTTIDQDLLASVCGGDDDAKLDNCKLADFVLTQHKRFQRIAAANRSLYVADQLAMAKESAGLWQDLKCADVYRKAGRQATWTLPG